MVHQKKGLNFLVFLQSSTIILSLLLLVVCGILGYKILNHSVKAVGEGTHYLEHWVAHYAYIGAYDPQGSGGFGSVNYQEVNVGDAFGQFNQTCGAGRITAFSSLGQNFGGPYGLGGCTITVVDWYVSGSVITCPGNGACGLGTFY